MTKEELAAKVNGREYLEEVTEAEEAEAKTAGLVIVFGASDDLMEFRGAIHDEQGAPGKALVDQEGLLPERSQIDDDDVLEKYFTRKKTARTIKALWCKDKPFAWTYETDIPHATFEVVEGQEKFSRGIVFALADLVPK